MITTVPTRRGDIPGLGERIRFARDARGWGQPDLAAEIGEAGGVDSYRLISRWETGAATPSALSLLGLSRALGVSVDWLLAGA